MAIFVSAGHNPAGLRPDPGAVAHGKTEALLASEFRDLVVSFIRPEYKVIVDKDCERLDDYLKRIQTGEGSVIIEFHFNAFNGKATGTETLVGIDADNNDKHFAREVADVTARILKIPNRGAKCESQSHRGRLWLMKKKGIVTLHEICFMDNMSDLQAFMDNKTMLAREVAHILMKYDDLI